MGNPANARRNKQRSQRYQLQLSLEPPLPEPTERDLRRAWRASEFPKLKIGFDEVMAIDCLAKCLRLYAIARQRRRLSGKTSKGSRA